MATAESLNGNSSANGDGLQQEKTKQLRLEVVYNLLAARSRMFEKQLETRRDISAECDYPKGVVDVSTYQELYDREPIPARVVEVIPRESWQVTPQVYEDDDAEVTTPFEESWAEVGRTLRGQKSWYGDELGSPVWEALMKADIASGIGSWSIILLGVDDGKALSEPLDGVEESYPDSITTPPDGRRISNPSWGGMTSGYLDVDLTQDPPVPYPDPSPSPTASPTSPSSTKPSKPTRRLNYLRVYKQAMVQITRYESNPNSPRHGYPTQYMVTLNGESQHSTGNAPSQKDVSVHWTRVIHVADNAIDSDWCGVPRMQPVLNRLLDLRKLYAGSAEMYWQGALPGWAFETHPQLGGDVEVSQSEVREMMEDFSGGLQRWMTLQGMSAKSLAPQVVDPTPQIMVQIEAICIRLGIPKRIFMGSERGELASGQDDVAWNDRLKSRHLLYLSPRMIAPFIDRLIACGVLSPPKDSYHISWPDLTSKSDDEKASLGFKRTQSLVAYVSGNGEEVLPPFYFMTRFLDFTEEEATVIIKEAEEANVIREKEEAEKSLEMMEEEARIEAENTPPGTPAAPAMGTPNSRSPRTQQGPSKIAE